MLANFLNAGWRRRRPLTRAVVLGAVACTTLLASCADSPTGPAAAPVAPSAPSASLLSPVTSLLKLRVDALTRDEPLATAQTRSWTVRRSTGATLAWPELGLQVVVPANAFAAAEMQITITALAGDVVAYDFGPDGSRFARPLTIVQSLKGTSYPLLPLGMRLRGAYFKDASQVDDANNQAIVNKLLPTVVDLLGRQVRFDVDHFSGYMVSTD